MSLTLLTKARTDLVMARFALQQDDDYFLQQAAYHTQQALEKEFKVVLQEYGIAYRKTHNLALLSELLPANQTVISNDDLDFLAIRADMIAKWESEVRYDTDYMAIRRQVVPVLEFAERVYSVVESWTCVRRADKFPPRESPAVLNNLNLD